MSSEIMTIWDNIKKRDLMNKDGNIIHKASSKHMEPKVLLQGAEDGIKNLWKKISIKKESDEIDGENAFELKETCEFNTTPIVATSSTTTTIEQVSAGPVLNDSIIINDKDNASQIEKPVSIYII